ncbi:MAG: hypothetical protein CMM56_05105 [Rhodospirillaceae bacterium]|nr:hypothetical protein [Rhodospirillaceae bacterium]
MRQKKEEAKFLSDPYLEWVNKEGIPITIGLGINLLDIDTRPWERVGVNAGLAHLDGRGDFVSIFVLDIPPGGKTESQQHLFEEVVYVLEGHGSTTVKTIDGKTHSFEWGPKSLFALPLNAEYRHFNGSGRAKVRLSSTNNLPLVMNLYHNEDFIFKNKFELPERAGKAGYFSGEGEFIPKRPGRHMWETNFVPNVSEFELKTWDKRGAGSSNMKFILADGTMHAHSSEMPVGTYKKAHRHGPDFHVFNVTGKGYSLLWYEGDNDFQRVDWTHGVVFAPPDGMYHQHYNTSKNPARYLAIALGSLRYPFTSAKRNLFEGVDVSIRDGGAQIEYEDQDSRIHQIYLSELADAGVASQMSDYIDESV